MAIDLPLARMTTAEKLRALETIWDDLARQPEQVPAPDWHGDVLRARADRAAKGESAFSDLAEAKARLTGRSQSFARR